MYTYAVQCLVDVLLLLVEKLEFLINSVSDCLVCGFAVVPLSSTVDPDVDVSWFDLPHFTHFIVPYCSICT